MSIGSANPPARDALRELLNAIRTPEPSDDALEQFTKAEAYGVGFDDGVEAAQRVVNAGLSTPTPPPASPSARETAEGIKHVLTATYATPAECERLLIEARAALATEQQRRKALEDAVLAWAYTSEHGSVLLSIAAAIHASRASEEKPNG